MSVSDIPTRKLYDCDGAAKNFPIPFQYMAEDNVTVKHIDSVGAITTLILDDIGANGFVITSDEVVTNTVYPNTDQIWLIRETPRTQSTVRKNNRRTAASVDDGSYDKLTMIDQEMEDTQERTLALADTTPTDVSVEIPAPVARRVPIWDATGKFLEYTTYDPDTQQSGAAASAAAALVSENNAADSETAAGVSETNAGNSETAAAGSAVDAAASAAGVNLPAIQVGDDNKLLQVNDAEDGYELTDTISLDTTGNAATATTSDKVGVLNVKVMNIGDWNMDSTAFKAVNHGVDGTKIKQIFVEILTDTSTGPTPLTEGVDNTDTTPQGSVSHSSTGVVMYRLDAGKYDDPAYDSTSFNRGFITIWYTD